MPCLIKVVVGKTSAHSILVFSSSTNQLHYMKFWQTGKISFMDILGYLPTIYTKIFKVDASLGNLPNLF